MKKRAVSLLLAILAVISLCIPASAANSKKCLLYVAGVPVANSEYQAVNGTNYITVRTLMSILDPGAMVEEENGTVTVSAVTVTRVVSGSGNTANMTTETLAFTARAGISYIEANGRYLYVEDGNRLVNGAVAVPVRVAAKVFNLVVGYDPSTHIATLTRQTGASAYLQPSYAYYDNDTLYWLGHVIYAESGNQSLEGKIAVGNVIMNRVASPQFPNTIYNVLFQKNQFSTASSGSIYREPNAESWIAAKLVLDGAVVLENATFFNVAGLKNTWAARNRTYITTIGGHDFYA